MNYRAITFCLLFLATLAISAWSLFLYHQPLPKHYTHAANEPDAFMEDVNTTILNRFGKPSMRIKSPKMMHYPKNDTTRIQHPYVTLYRQSSEPWFVSAEEATTLKGIKKIFLTKQVHVYHPADIFDPEMGLNTESLTLFPNKEEAHTEEAVTIHSPDAVIHAIGMNANFNTGKVHLLSHIRSEYVPPS